MNGERSARSRDNSEQLKLLGKHFQIQTQQSISIKSLIYVKENYLTMCSDDEVDEKVFLNKNYLDQLKIARITNADIGNSGGRYSVYSGQQMRSC